MTMLVQPRPIKWYAAGQQKDWELAAFELNERRGALRRIAQTSPKYRTYRTDDIDSAVGFILRLRSRR
jgi:hypothetical protein